MIVIYTDGACSGNPGPSASWFLNGGKEVLLELRNEEEVENDRYTDSSTISPRLGVHRVNWLKSMKSHLVSGGVLFVHAGLPPDMDIGESLARPWLLDFNNFGKQSQERHWAWVRDSFLDHVPGSDGHQGHFVVHGHSTPSNDRTSISEQLMNRSRINIDGGSYKTGKVRMVHITGNQLNLYEASKSPIAS